jgi:hypothetical protein
MCTVAEPMSAPEALATLQTVADFLAGLDAAELPAAALGQYIPGPVQADAVLAAALAPLLAAYDAKDGHLGVGGISRPLTRCVPRVFMRPFGSPGAVILGDFRGRLALFCEAIRAVFARSVAPFARSLAAGHAVAADSPRREMNTVRSGTFGGKIIRSHSPPPRPG